MLSLLLVILGGCGYGGNFGAETTTIDETIVGETTIIRFAGTQSVDEESFAVDFANLEVLPGIFHEKYRKFSPIG